MALRSIRKEGDEVLRKESKPVTEFNRRLEMLIDDMFETMYDANGCGLAAVQVGVLKQVVVIDIDEPDGKLVMINTEILEMEGEDCGPEGCLSIPGKRGNVVRPTKITVKALDRDGQPFTRVAEGFLARCMCHEIDHLHGILYADKVVSWETND